MNKDMCPEHHEPAIGQCIKCGNPICTSCREMRGYYCSDSCLAATASFRSPEATQKQWRRAEVSHKLGIAFKSFFFLIILAGVALLGWWIWNTFYNPVGRVEWNTSIAMPVKHFRLLKKSKKELQFLAGDRLVGVNPLSGKQATDKRIKKLTNYKSVITDFDFCNVGYSKKSIGVYDKSWTLLWQKKISEKVVEHIDANDNIVMVVLGLDWSNYEDCSPEEWKTIDRSKIVRFYNLETGKKLGERKFKPDKAVGSRFCLTNDALIYLSYPKKRRNHGIILNFYNLQRRKRKRKIFELGINWGPVLKHGYLWLRSGDNLIAMTTDGKEEVLHLNSPALWGETPFVYKKPFLFIQSGGAISCIDLKKKRLLWQNSFAEHFSSIAFTKKRIYFLTEDSTWVDSNIPKKNIKLPDMNQVKKGKFVNAVPNNAGPKRNKRLKTVGTVFCIDSKTGKTLWKKAGMRGDLAASSKRLLVITDTAQTSRMNVANKGKGITILRQLDINNGSVYYERKNNHGLARPYLVLGRHLICPEYERIASGLPGMFGGGSEKSSEHLGIMSFLLK